MSKFKFRFDVLLRLKNQLEQDTKNRLGIAIMELEKEKEILEKKLKLKIEKKNEMGQKVLENVTVKVIREYNNFLKGLEDIIEKCQQNVNQKMKNVDIIREELIEVTKERQILDKLKEKDLEKYNKEVIKEEQLLADEVTGYKYATKN